MKLQKKSTYLAFLIFLIMAPLILMGVGLFCCSYKKGFSVQKISSKLPYNEIWETRSVEAEEKEHLVKNVFTQTFYYLGSGNQCYAFASADNKYVLKFFKMHKLLPKNWLTDFPFSLFEKYRLDNVEKKQHFFENTFKSFKYAYEQLPKESGIIFLHLNKTRDLKSKVMLIGYGGKKFFVDLDSKEFVVQLKAERICDFLFRFKNSEKEDELHLAVRSFLELIAARCRQGFGDQDTGIRNNLGFVNGRAIFIDCGNLFVDESLKYPHYFQKEILRATERLAHWAEDFYPELTLILQEEAHLVIDKYLR